jgi:hypothetical protein
MTGVRWREDTGFEGKCDDCREYWPLDVEFWSLKHGLVRCHACHLEVRRQRESGRRRTAFMSPEALARKRARDNERKRQERMDPERGDRLRERERLAQRRQYERNRAAQLARRRDYYARQAAAEGREVRVGFGRPRLEDVA